MSATEERRRASRINASLAVVVSKGGDHYVVEAENVSETGLCLRSEEVFPVGTQHHLLFAQQPELPPLSAEGIVRWCEGGDGVGVEFTSMSPEDRQALLRFVNSQSRCAQA